MIRMITVGLVFCSTFPVFAQEVKPQWKPEISKALVKARENRTELEKALTSAPLEQRKGMEFLVANMPDSDLLNIKAAYLLNNTELAYQARKIVPWGKSIPEDVFFNNVLPYANIDETRDEWRKEFFDLCLPLIKNAKTPTEAALTLNREIFPKLKVRYSTQRKAPNQSPKESMASGLASCTGLSIMLSDACRSVCVPTRIVGTPLWANKRGNHTWVEIWDKDWHFTGACEPDPNGLDRGWFVGDAAQAKKDSFEHAIYASSFKRTDIHFPLVWAKRNTNVPAENVTDRYAKKKDTDSVRLMIQVVNQDQKRIAVPVTITDAKDDKKKWEGQSKGESVDTNDFLTFTLPPHRVFNLTVGPQTLKVETNEVGKEQLLKVAVPGGQVSPTPGVIEQLKTALEANPGAWGKIAGQDFAKVPLTKSDAIIAQDLIWKSHVAVIQKERKREFEDRVLKRENLEMPFEFKTFGVKPKNGWSLWISMHGGGGAPKAVNDRQWENQKKLYTPEEGIYLAPRAPTNTWDLWHAAHIDDFFNQLIQDMIVLADVNPDRVYIMGYSAGGDGVYQLAPRMADRWAAAAMMAGHPNGVPLLSLRNVPFALQVGGNDSAYNRNKVAQQYGEQLKKLNEDDPHGYKNFVKIHEGKGHWMNLEDKAALPWMAKFTRNPTPEKIVWKQSGSTHDRFYWLAVPPKEAKSDSLVVAKREGQTITIEKSEKIERLVIRFDDQMADLDKPVKVIHNGKALLTGKPNRTIAVMVNTLGSYGDPKLIFNSELTVDLAKE